MRLSVDGKASTVPSWYQNSWRALESFRTMHKYEQVYGVKIITFEEYITHVEFPTEDEATLFLLKWS